MDKLGNQLIKIATYRKVGENIGCHPFQCKTEVDKVDEIQHESHNIHKVEEGIDKSLVNLMIPELKGDTVKKDNREIDNEDRRNIETQANKKDPHHLTETEVGKILLIEEVETDPGKKKDD